jgi:general L-amino acid transport system permease protein
MPAENSKNQNNVVATRWIYDPKVRGIIFQAVAVACVAWMLFYFISNALHNMETRGIATGFAFLDNRASFGIAQTLISYSEDDTYGRAFIIGLLNTLLVSAIGIVFATALGFVVGIARLSKNWLLSRAAAVYIETFRNIPLLLQIFFWYFCVLRNLPAPRQSMSLGDAFFLNVRGLSIPAPVIESGFLSLSCCNSNRISSEAFPLPPGEFTRKTTAFINSMDNKPSPPKIRETT